MDKRMGELKRIIKQYSDEFGWIDDNEFCVWVHWIDTYQFLNELRKWFGMGIFDDGGFNANVQDGCLCFTLSDTYLDIEEIYPKKDYRH